MPQMLTHDPSRVKVGDELWLLQTVDSINRQDPKNLMLNGSFYIKPAVYRVLRVTQTLVENNREGLGGPRKRKFTYSLVNSCVDSSNSIPDVVEARHSDLLFHSLEELNKWLDKKQREWVAISKRHVERRDALEDIIYI